MKSSILIFAVTLVACGRQSNLIHLIIPDGYTGPIIFAEVEGRGSGYKMVDGRYVYSIPASGVLCVDSFAPFQHWHRLTAEYSNGGVIYSGTGLPQPPGPEAIRIQELSQIGHSIHVAGEPEPRTWPMEIWMGVGTHDQVSKVAQLSRAEQTGFDIRRCSDT